MGVAIVILAAFSSSDYVYFNVNAAGGTVTTNANLGIGQLIKLF